jgi:hypothetical protein
MGYIVPIPDLFGVSDSPGADVMQTGAPQPHEESIMALTTFSGPVRSLNGFIAGDGSTITKVRSGSASLNFGSIDAAAQADLTIAITGAVVGDEVIMALPAAPAAGLIFNAFVSAADTVTVRASNITAAPIDPAAATFGAIVIAA